MSVVVAIKSDGVVYMGCDTQTTRGKDNENRLQEADFKINKLSNGMLIGCCGMVAAEQSVRFDESIFDFQGDSLTKKDIVNNIIPRIKSKLKNAALDDNKDEEMPVSFTIAHKDKLFVILTDFLVLGIEDYCAEGSGLFCACASLADKNLPIRERLLAAMRASAKYCASVGKPFVLVDTKKLQYEIVEG